MTRSLLSWVVLPLSLAMVMWSSVTASAAHRSPMEEAAREYRASVREFEDHVDGLRYIDRYDERLVQRLEDVARELESASRHPENLSRLLYHWNEIQSLQPRVEEAIFGRGVYPLDHSLQECWVPVAASFACVATEIDCLLGHPAHHAPVPIRRHVGYPVNRPTSDYRAYGDAGHHPPTAYPSSRPRVIASPLPQGSTHPRDVRGDSWDRGRLDHDPAPSAPRRTITISPRHEPAAPIEHRVDSRDVGAMVISSLLTRLLER